MQAVLSYNPKTKTAFVQPVGNAPPAGATNVSTFEIPDPKYPEQLLYHKVRDALYHIGVYDMGFVTIRAAGVVKHINNEVALAD